MTEVETFASRGWILREKVSAVSHTGWLDSSQDERALACRRGEFACLINTDGDRAAKRPRRAASAMRSVAPSIEH